jgi:hypothetical protein
MPQGGILLPSAPRGHRAGLRGGRADRAGAMPVFLDGAGLREWRDRHPAGFVAEVRAEGDAVLQWAGYPRLGQWRSVWGWPIPYPKACGAVRADVEGWARVEGHDAMANPCCAPTGGPGGSVDLFVGKDVP